MLLTSLTPLQLTADTTGAAHAYIIHRSPTGRESVIFDTILFAPQPGAKITFDPSDIIRYHMRQNLMPIATYDICGSELEIIHNIIPDKRTEEQIRKEIQNVSPPAVGLRPEVGLRPTIAIDYIDQHLCLRTVSYHGKWEEKHSVTASIANVSRTPTPYDAVTEQTIEITTAPLPGYEIQEARLIGIASQEIDLHLPYGTGRFDLPGIIEKSEIATTNTPGEAPVLKLTIRPAIPEGRLIGLSYETPDPRIFTEQFESQFK